MQGLLPSFAHDLPEGDPLIDLLADRGIETAVSTYGQTLDAQLEHCAPKGCAKIFRERMSSARPDRRELLKTS
jgi:hypothetical protein